MRINFFSPKNELICLKKYGIMITTKLLEVLSVNETKNKKTENKGTEENKRIGLAIAKIAEEKILIRQT